MDANPYQTTKQRQETEVHDLLDKIQPEMITLNPDFLGKVDRAPAEVIEEEQRKEWEVFFICFIQANHPNEKFVPRKRARGKSSSQRRYLRKQGNVVDEKRMAMKAKLEAIKVDREQKRSGVEVVKTALDRFL
jgi:U3 small nucleolar RNA-associated protein 7